MARGQPCSDSNVRAISSSFDWTRTCTQTSSGMRPLLDQAAREIELDLRGGGEADLDLLEADLHQQVENSSFSSTLIGTASAWLPSRRSTLHQIGARSIVRSGHAVGHFHGRERPVFLDRIHDFLEGGEGTQQENMKGMRDMKNAKGKTLGCFM
jgi:hypothetical protein